MDPLFDRLGRLFRSWSTDKSSDSFTEDPDQRAAEEELDAFLRGEPPRRPSSQGSKSYHHERPTHEAPKPALDPKILSAYQVLGLTGNESWGAIETAHKALLRQHHPDRHANNPRAYQEATLISQRLNEAFQTLKKHWGR